MKTKKNCNCRIDGNTSGFSSFDSWLYESDRRTIWQAGCRGQQL